VRPIASVFHSNQVRQCRVGLFRRVRPVAEEPRRLAAISAAEVLGAVFQMMTCDGGLRWPVG
jgi:hypothetical protein